jgi:diguanylate cyclase (GGDEF)-like protein/PAS domain S-box-containing protein
MKRINIMAGLPMRTAAFVGLACLALLAMSGWHQWTSRQTDLRTTEIEMQNLARSLMQHAEDTFELADTILGGLVARLESQGSGKESVERLQAYMRMPRGESRIRGMFVYNENGEWLATTETVDIKSLNNSDREYFQRHKASPDRTSFIGTPVKSRSSGQWVVTVSRRFNHPDGRFAGVVLTTIDVAYFAKVYRQYDVGENGSISLLSKGGVMLARVPNNDAFVGRDFSNTPLFKQQLAHNQGAAYYFTSPVDGRHRLSLYQSGANYPLIVLATRAKDEVLLGWWSNAVVQIGLTLGLVAILAAAGLQVVRRLIERQRLERALVAKEADFRLLAEQSSDMVMRIDFDGIVRYVSPSCVHVLGWTAEQLNDTAALAGINKDDLERVQHTVTALQLGEITEARVIYRNRHREKGEVWLETAMRATRNPETGQIDGVVAISRDMTEQKDLEQKLDVLARQDSLTGIANRRHFDERLAHEWARARRAGTTLSLLMLDVDHFKVYNDEYGHQAGDRCLHAVARVIAQHAQRPADLAARYGGEEFALLLPDTDETGARLIADRVRLALSEANIPHAGNPPMQRVTISVGGSTSRPAMTTADENSLVQASDNALYDAKNTGRDRASFAGEVILLGKARRA